MAFLSQRTRGKIPAPEVTQSQVGGLRYTIEGSRDMVERAQFD